MHDGLSAVYVYLGDCSINFGKVGSLTIMEYFGILLSFVKYHPAFCALLSSIVESVMERSKLRVVLAILGDGGISVEPRGEKGVN